MATYGTANLNFGRSARAHRRDIRRALTVHGVDVLAVQELRRPMREGVESVARTFQPRRTPTQAGSEALFVARRSAVRIIRRGSIVASHDLHGQPIGERRLPWLLTDDPDLDTCMLTICYHRVPLRMQDSRIDEAQDDRVRRLVEWAESEGWHWIVLGDMNQLERADPADLRRLHDGSWHGERIDLICVSPGLRVVREWHKQDPKRGDKHPLVAVDVCER